MIITDTYFAHSDDRGEIWDILTDEIISSVSFITFNKDAIRGNHIHHNTSQWNYLFSGSLEVVVHEESQKEFKIEPGQIFLIEPGIAHAMRAKQKSQLFVFTLGDRAGTRFEEDTFRLKTPLI